MQLQCLLKKEMNVVFGTCQFINVEIGKATGSLHSGLVLLACTVYREVYLPNLNIDAL